MSKDEAKLQKELKEVDDDKKLTASEKEARKGLIVERYQFEDEAENENKTRTGKGLRVAVGSTRGRSTINIKYEAFDESDKASLPTTVEEFCNLSGTEAKNQFLVPLLITGFNDKAYSEASDPIAEHVNKAWDDDTRTKFRNVVRGIVAMQGISIQEAVDMVKPGVEKKFAAK